MQRGVEAQDFRGAVAKTRKRRLRMWLYSLQQRVASAPPVMEQNPVEAGE